MSNEKTTRSKIYFYEGEDIKVGFDKHRCIHAAQCGRSLPSVFDPKARPWVKPDEGALDDILAVVNRCPSGALKVYNKDGKELGQKPQNTMRVEDSGPLMLRGDLQLSIGGEVLEETRLTLCRCGKSKNKPYCDGSHSDGFTDPGGIAKEGSEDSTASASEAVSVSMAANGPLITKGAVVVQDAVGATKVVKERAFLCRCGASNTKPWCDGSHKAIDFEAEGS